MIDLNSKSWFYKVLTQEELYALARATTLLRFQIWQSYCDALDKVAEQYAEEILRLVPQFGLVNILLYFRTKQRHERILRRDLVEAIRRKVGSLI